MMKLLLLVVLATCAVLAQSWERHSTFPPSELIETDDRHPLAAWYRDHPYEPKARELSDRQKQLLRWTAREYVDARKAGTVSCEEYATVLVDQMLFYKDAQQFMITSYELSGQIIQSARDMDAKAAREGIEAIAPLYGLPVPMKGTMATTDFPSSAGSSLLDQAHAKADAAFTSLFRAANAVVMGKTNVPDFAASWITMNPLNERTMNLYDGGLTSGGSSGGSAAAVSAHVAPVAVTEDTGGSTRHPAFQNNNFGYDPSRNHYPNQGNPGISYTNDQVGLNTRDFGDVLLIDQAVLGTADQHAAARAFVGSKADADISVGAPLYPFVELNLPWDGYNFWNLKNATVSTGLRAKYEQAKQALGDAGVKIIQEEWPQVDSKFFGRSMNAAIDTLFGNRRINNQDYDGVGATHLHSFTGQVAEWVRSYLGVSVSLPELWDAAVDGGDGHSPRGFLGISGITDESQFRAVGHVQLEKLAVWNSYFDAHHVDVIMTPGQFCDAITYPEMADSTLPLRVRQEDGSYLEEPSSLPQCNLLSYFAFKDAPIPKVMVPTGLDPNGKPTAVLLWGRGVPEDKLFDDEYAKVHDIQFLHVVERLVGHLHSVPSLQRQDAPTVMRSLAAATKEL